MSATDTLNSSRVITEIYGSIWINLSVAVSSCQLIDGKNIAIVDDVINAGSAVCATLVEMQPFGARPVMIGALLVLGNVGQKYLAERNLPLRSISRIPNEIWEPKDCPLCASQVPLTQFD